MKAIRLESPRNFAYLDCPEPPAPGPGEAIVRTHSVGICGTDLSSYLGKFPFFNYPRIPGHELGVEVLAVGAGVAHVKPGDRCSVEPYINSPESFASRRGLSNCCQQLQVLGVHTDGGLCEQFAIRADKLHVSQLLEFEQLALVETLAIGCHAVHRAAPRAGEHFLIMGAGPIGLAVLEFARLEQCNISMMDMNPERLAFCRDNYGIENAVQFKGDGSEVEAMQKITGGEMYPLVVDATGSAASMSNALNYVGHGGTLVYVGITTQEITFPHRLLHVREATIKASRNALPEDFRRIIRLIEEGQIDTKPWITHRTSFAELAGTFDSYTKPASGVIKAMVSMP
jgi:2-desacetyl-2-hydroxyethyl bacteriochlorophyllide A dehydrogenase